MQQILMSGSVRNRVLALNGKRRKKGLEEKGENTERR